MRYRHRSLQFAVSPLPKALGSSQSCKWDWIHDFKIFWVYRSSFLNSRSNRDVVSNRYFIAPTLSTIPQRGDFVFLPQGILRRLPSPHTTLYYIIPSFVNQKTDLETPSKIGSLFNLTKASSLCYNGFRKKQGGNSCLAWLTVFSFSEIAVSQC